MNQMLSIIIPTLNEERYLRKLLQSLANQSYEGKIEIIVADAGSTDKTKQIAENFGCKITKGGLPAKGRNEGAKTATGNLLLFVDADMILPADFLNKNLKEFNQRNLDVATTLFTLRNTPWVLKILGDIFYSFPVLVLERVLPHATGLVLVKKKLHNKIGGFDEEVKLAEDHYYVRVAARQGKFGILRSVRFSDSPRRFRRDGWLRSYIKFVLAELYMILFGPIKSDIFNYKFGHYHESQ